tara:strand:+ start:139 stop:528 length:390 start_codon:yes stop_codon:yes gene_type:complete
MTERSEETKKFFADIDKRIGQSEKRARDRSYELRKGMAISEEHKKAIERGKLESDARRKQLKKQSKQNRIDAKKRRKQVEQQNKKYFNSKNAPKMIQPKSIPAPVIGRPRSEFTIKGGSGPRGKQLKRI